MVQAKTELELEAENERLRRELDEAKETIEAIRRGSVDALLIDGSAGPQVYMLAGADEPYRAMVEEMQEGAVTLREDGVVLYCNKQIARMLRISPEDLLGKPFGDFVTSGKSAFDSILSALDKEGGRCLAILSSADGIKVPVLLAFRPLQAIGWNLISLVVADLTEQKRHEERLEEQVSERTKQLSAAMADAKNQATIAIGAAETIRHLSLIPDQDPNPVLRISRDGLIVYANPASLPHLANLDLAPGKRLPDEWAKPFAEFYDAGKFFEHEFEVGEEIFSLVVTPIAGEGYINIYGRNITHRKRAEDELIQVHQRLRALMDALPVGVSFSDDATCRTITGNPACLSQFEVMPYDNLSASAPDPDAPGRRLRFFKDGLPIADTELPLQRAVAENRQIEPVELEVSLPSGRRWHASVSAAPVRNADDNVVGGVAVTVDVTARKIAEQRTKLLSDIRAELLASDNPKVIVQSICRRVMEHLDCHAFFNFLVDEASNCLRLNACAGIAAETARKIERLDFGVAVCGCVARDGMRIVAEDIQNTPDPRTDLVRGFGIQAYACHPLLNEGRVIGTLSFGSKTKAAFSEDELELMKSVTDHVAIAMQRIRLMESLAHHARAAEAANEAKGRFLANMSHELRTPMNSILGLIDVAIPKAIHPTVKDCLDTARESADLLLALLNDLLDSAKIEAGKLELESAPFSLRQMLDQISRALSVRASEKGLCFSCRIPGDVPDTVVGDRIRLRQVLLNLAGNAIKFTDEGEVEIVLCTLSRKGEAVLQFSVRDTGIGIAASQRKRLFQPFVQSDASMARRFGGTGLGLSICKNLVELMGGCIRVKSKLGKGSTFSFNVRLPLAVTPTADSPASPAASLPALAPLRILLVEDNLANQKLVNYVLRDRGHEVETAGEGREAIELVKRNRYDVILMDVQMPGMNGLDATTAIRKRERGGRRTPIIAMTAHALKEDRDRCLAVGMDGYLSKPVNVADLHDLIEKLARGIPPADSPGTAPVPPEPHFYQTAEKFDFDRALSICYGNAHMVREMIQYFHREIEDVFPLMRAALESGDLQAVGRLGHRLKGTLIYLGVRPVVEAAKNVERFYKTGGGTASEALEAVEKLEWECSALKAGLNTQLPATASVP